MVFAWGLLAPVGIMLPLFYKVVWPDGQWFYVSEILVFSKDIAQWNLTIA